MYYVRFLTKLGVYTQVLEVVLCRNERDHPLPAMFAPCMIYTCDGSSTEIFLLIPQVAFSTISL